MSSPGRRSLIVDEVEALHQLQRQEPGSDLWSRSANLSRPLRGPLHPVSSAALFQPHNIVGRTGSEETASVYYRAGDTFSHVTTSHLKENNVGRSKVRTHFDYRIGNNPKTKRSEEFYRGGIRHESRNPFEQMASVEERRAYHAIASRFPNPKSKY